MNTKRYATALVLAGLIMGAGVPALARETPSPTPGRSEQARTKAQERDQKLREKTQGQRERVGKFWERMRYRLERLIKNQRQLADRIGRRLDKAAASGKDVTALRAKLNDARILIVNAEAELKNTTQKVQDLVASGADPKEILKQTRELNQKVLRAIKAAHEALVDIIVSTRGLGNVLTPTPTPTAS